MYVVCLYSDLHLYLTPSFIHLRFNFLLDTTDVAHYTGPSKPWAPLSPVEENALRPWLNMMEQEGLDLPEQLPAQPTKDLFAVLTSPRSGSEWLMTMLDQHPEVCASGESKKPEMGFPTEAMLSQGTSWLPICSIKKGCTLGIVLDGISEFTRVVQSWTHPSANQDLRLPTLIPILMAEAL